MRTSAGLLLHRARPSGPEVLLGHMGGPFWSRRPRAWTIPKGEPAPGEDLYAAALREFAEETGLVPPPGPETGLGTVRQRGGKHVTAWAREADLDVRGARGATVTVVWPPGSGRVLEVPELDRLAWWPLPTARDVVVAAQAELLDRLATHLAGPAG